MCRVISSVAGLVLNGTEAEYRPVYRPPSDAHCLFSGQSKRRKTAPPPPINMAAIPTVPHSIHRPGSLFSRSSVNPYKLQVLPLPGA